MQKVGLVGIAFRAASRKLAQEQLAVGEVGCSGDRF